MPDILKKLGELLLRILPLLLILIVTIVGWFWLSDVALRARVQNPVDIAKGPNIEDYKLGRVWGTELLALAGTLAGFLGIAAAAGRPTFTVTDAERVEGGMVGILAGATLLGVGGWPVPVALAAMVTGSATVRVLRAWKKPDKP